MRIKSYFAPSVQSAISLARKEFGEGVTLVTSHVAAAESRELGEYEVVFAIDESPDSSVVEPDSLVPDKPRNNFQSVLQEAITTPASPELNLPEKLDQLRSLFVEIGIEPLMVRALMTMVERCIPVSQPVPARKEEARAEAPAASSIEPSLAAHPSIQLLSAPEDTPGQKEEETPPPASGKPKYSAAELAFLSSVSDSQKTAPASLPDWKFGS